MSPELATLRRMLLGLFVFAAAGTIGELLLAKHTEDVLQLIPLILLGLSLLALATLRLAPGGAGLRLFQVVMWCSMLSGIVGAALHYRAKAEFALERGPALTGVALFREAMKGRNPPLLAPGTMIALGLLGLIWTYRQRGAAAGHLDTTGDIA